MLESLAAKPVVKDKNQSSDKDAAPVARGAHDKAAKTGSDTDMPTTKAAKTDKPEGKSSKAVATDQPKADTSPAYKLPTGMFTTVLVRNDADEESGNDAGAIDAATSTTGATPANTAPGQAADTEAPQATTGNDKAAANTATPAEQAAAATQAAAPVQPQAADKTSNTAARPAARKTAITTSDLKTAAADPKAMSAARSEKPDDAPASGTASSDSRPGDAKVEAARPGAKAVEAAADAKDAPTASASPQPQDAATPAPAPVNAAPVNAAPAAAAANAPTPIPGVAQAQPIAATASLVQVAAQPHAAAETPTLQALAVQIAARSQSGARQFDIRLDPPELGRVDVRLSIDQTGKASAHLSADQPQTLDLLQKDSSSLSRALRDAGLDVSQNGLNFSLRQQAGENSGGNATGSRLRGRSTSLHAIATPAVTAGAASFNRASAPGRLDISV